MEPRGCHCQQMNFGHLSHGMQWNKVSLSSKDSAVFSIDGVGTCHAARLCSLILCFNMSIIVLLSLASNSMKVQPKLPFFWHVNIPQLVHINELSIFWHGSLGLMTLDVHLRADTGRNFCKWLRKVRALGIHNREICEKVRQVQMHKTSKLSRPKELALWCWTGT
jgi:hypothetical protein